jgi:hypothetical protein
MSEIKKDVVKKMGKIKSPIHESLSKVFGGQYNEKEQKRMAKKSLSYRLKHF